MKLIITDMENARKNEQYLRSERLKGNMVCLLAECSRRKLMRSYRTLANYYVADSGEFAFSGCYTLHNVRSAYLDRVIEILNKYRVRYAFRLEYANACGGLQTYACSDEQISNEEYTYVVSFDSEEQKQAVQEECADLCIFGFTDHDSAYIRFRDIQYKDAVRSILSSQKIDPEDVIDQTGGLL